MKKNNKNCILATDFSQVDKDMEKWHLEREKKGNIYRAFSEYIECLQTSLLLETDFYKRILIEKEIKKLKKEQKKYYEPSILGHFRFDHIQSDNRLEKSLKKSSFSLVKKLSKN